MGPIHHTTGGEGDSATPPPHHRGGRGKISYGTSIWDPSTTPQGGGGGQCHTPTTPQGGRGKISYGTSIWDPSHMGGGRGGWQGLVHIYNSPPFPPADWFTSSLAVAQSPPGTQLACRHWQQIWQHPHPQHHCFFPTSLG